MKDTKAQYILIAHGTDNWVCIETRDGVRGGVANTGTLAAMLIWLTLRAADTHELRLRKSGHGYAARFKRITP